MMAYTAAYIGLIYDSVYMTKKYNIKLHNEIYDYEIKKVSELKQFESELKLRQDFIEAGEFRQTKKMVLLK